MKTLENKFNVDMKNIYLTAKKELGYNASLLMTYLQTSKMGLTRERVRQLEVKAINGLYLTLRETGIDPLMFICAEKKMVTPY